MKQGLLSKEEVIQHRVLIDDCFKQMRRDNTPKVRKQELYRHIQTLKRELLAHGLTKKKTKPVEKVYMGAEF